MIRLFTAIEIPESLRTRLSLLQGGIPGARWSPVENFHLTLRFIGEVSETTANDIDDVLEGVRGSSFMLTLKGVGEFGGRDPRAIWAGIAPSEPLMRLAAKIESALQRMGLAAETRKYSPHVTLARLKDPPIAKVQEFLVAHTMFESTPFPVRSFALFSSHMRAGGSQYQVERTYELR